MIAWARRFTMQALPLASGSHAAVRGCAISKAALAASSPDSGTVALKEPRQLRVVHGDQGGIGNVLLVNNGLHLELVIDRTHPIGRDDAAGVADVILEAAVTTIWLDLDSIAPSIRAMPRSRPIAIGSAFAGERWSTPSRKTAGRSPRRLNAGRSYTAPDGGF